MRTEQIIFEAKEAGRRMKASCDSDTESRRSSITIDDNGMIIQRGFLAPVSRSSSQNSLACTLTNSSASSSFIADFNTPATSFGSPAPGYSRPTGSLYHAAEFRRLRKESATSLLLPVQNPPLEVVWRPRPGMGERRRTWQTANHRASQSTSSSYKGDESALGSSKRDQGSAATTEVQRVSQSTPSSYKDDNGMKISKDPTEFGAKRAVSRVASPSASLLSESLMESRMKQKSRSAFEAQMKRSGECGSTGKTPNFGGREQRSSSLLENGQSPLKQKEPARSDSEHAEDDGAAIASDGEDDDDFIDDSDVTIMRNRNCYAERRALNDARVI
ncbi:uncharacterized protein MYCFIDRAFT_84263 [Pseudocercospora fijiensis CIRAD86]|uniref:Uncharacterized protein n=1 Tax=Pseudocercospora fijiensis (strain CIRAD86) TaxID=383855 RepID=N1Q5K7_PSEFD|nr:uncharacterized protein MYCFIDRAFT_84263 [Pseudocercospora fijiensis CIRAD86]EME87139.1 hypothetical protein MYCFIDRAFT_84263 [Pseudocercospora fijiensis CIRAD86]